MAMGPKPATTLQISGKSRKKRGARRPKKTIATNIVFFPAISFECELIKVFRHICDFPRMFVKNENVT